MTCHVCGQFSCMGECMNKVLNRPVFNSPQTGRCSSFCHPEELCMITESGKCDVLKPRILFPTMLRKMWSGAEVQAWLDKHVNKERS